MLVGYLTVPMLLVCWDSLCLDGAGVKVCVYCHLLPGVSLLMSPLPPACHR